jgi:hypothetical protein
MTDLAWGKRVSAEFKTNVFAISDELEVNPNYLMASIAFETGETFSPSIRNAAGSGAIGLIQFMPSTAHELGTSTEDLSSMIAEDQLTFVLKYFRPKKGKLKDLSDVYMTILWPSAVGKEADYVLFDKYDSVHPKRYLQNAGLDFNKDGVITKLEATVMVQKKFDKELQSQFVG